MNLRGNKFPITSWLMGVGLLMVFSGCQKVADGENDDSDAMAPLQSTGTDSDQGADATPVCPVPTELLTTELDIKQEDASCFPRRLDWNPDSQVSMCHLTLEYRYDQSEYDSAPPCPTDNGQQWEDDEGDLMQESKGDGSLFWVRACMVKKRPYPILCDDMAENEDDENSESEPFEWFYCENPGENNAIACADGADNDRDGNVDADDEDCFGCVTGEACDPACPYNVSLSTEVLREAASADSANIICLRTYQFEDDDCHLQNEEPATVSDK